MEEVQLIMIRRQHNITIQRHNILQAQHESMTLSLRQSWRSIVVDDTGVVAAGVFVSLGHV